MTECALISQGKELESMTGAQRLNTEIQGHATYLAPEIL